MSLVAAAVAPFIERQLNKFLKLDGRGIDTKGGKLRLKRVSIRESAVDDLALPVVLRGGLIEEVEVRAAAAAAARTRGRVRFPRAVVRRLTSRGPSSAPTAW